MAHRTQITLTDAQYERIRREAERTGTSLAELVRRALDATYGTLPTEEKVRLLRRSAGAWREAPGEDRAAYLRRLRGPGLGTRLADGDGG
jgi:hypothetical protein